MPNDIDSKKRWKREAEKYLLGRKIVAVRYMMDEEVELYGWDSAALVIILDDGTIFFPSQDDEGNNAGAIFGQTKNDKDFVLPVI